MMSVSSGGCLVQLQQMQKAVQICVFKTYEALVLVVLGKQPKGSRAYS